MTVAAPDRRPCPFCGEAILIGARKCRFCNEVLDEALKADRARQASAAAANDPALALVVPLGRSGLAIAAGYLGLLAMIPFLAPVALVVSILALRDFRAHPEKKGRGRAVFGLIMGITFTILLASILPGLLGKR